MATVEIPAGELTLLVAPAATDEHDAPSLVGAYPVDLGNDPEEVTDVVIAICQIEQVRATELTVLGVEFDDPEQHNTRVTVSGSSLRDLVLRVEGMDLSGQGSLDALLRSARLREALISLEAPVYA